MVTDKISLIYAVIPPHWHQTVHYHEAEAILMGLDGHLSELVGGVPHPLGAGHAVIPPANVEHGMVNDVDAPATMVEFQAVRRSDWLPPYTAMPVVKSPQPSTLRALLSSSARNVGARSTGTPGTVIAVFESLTR